MGGQPPRTSIVRWQLTAELATVLVADLITPAASADEKVLLGSGAGIALNGDPCMLAIIGHDSAGALVGFTSAHCGGPGAAVTADGAAGTVGNVVTAGDGLDCAVIRFDPAKVAPTPDFDRVAIIEAPVPVNDLLAGHDPRWLPGETRVTTPATRDRVVQRDPECRQRQRRPWVRVYPDPGITGVAPGPKRSAPVVGGYLERGLCRAGAMGPPRVKFRLLPAPPVVAETLMRTIERG